MPRVRTSKTKFPEGWDVVEETLEAIAQKMREVESEEHEGKRTAELMWPIFRLHHQRSRYIYEMYYKKKKVGISLFHFYLPCLSHSWLFLLWTRLIKRSTSSP